MRGSVLLLDTIGMNRSSPEQHFAEAVIMEGVLLPIGYHRNEQSVS